MLLPWMSVHATCSELSVFFILFTKFILRKGNGSNLNHSNNKFAFCYADWRWHPGKYDPKYFEILRLFLDKKGSPYSIHQIGMLYLFL